MAPSEIGFVMSNYQHSRPIFTPAWTNMFENMVTLWTKPSEKNIATRVTDISKLCLVSYCNETFIISAEYILICINVTFYQYLCLTVVAEAEAQSKSDSIPNLIVNHLDCSINIDHFTGSVS